VNLRTTLRQLPDLERSVHTFWQQIPPGRVATYGELARALGDPAASRWVGLHALQHAHQADCACHRIVRSNGQAGHYYTGHARDKLGALQKEGVPCPAAHVDLQVHAFTDFCGPAPLRRLQQLQTEVGARAPGPNRAPFARIAGVDLSYRESIGVAAYVEVETRSMQVVMTRIAQARIHFPYIPSYLSFRELPLLCELISQVRGEGQLADVVLVDGTGILHPRGAGLATMLGMAADVPTVGVTKRLLFGKLEPSRVLGPGHSIGHDQTVLGVAIAPRPTSRRPLFVSPGYGVSIEDSAQLVARMLQGHRLPEPLYWADRLSRQAARALETSGW
jgi:deoxyribonuclease V